MRTLVIGSDRPARYTLGPHKLPVEPLVWPPGAATERVMKELHAELSLRRKLREPRIAAQIVAPDFRIDLGNDRIANELAREFGAEADALVTHWQRAREIARLYDPLLGSEHAFPGVGFFERRETAKLADAAAAAANTWWQEAERDGIWRHLAAIALRHPDAQPIAIARALDAWHGGPPALRGDSETIRELLVEKLTTAGGEIRAGKLADATVSWGKLTTIRMHNGDDIGAGQVVSSLPPQRLAELLGKKAPKKLLEVLDATQLVGYRYTFNIVLDEAGVPEHMAPTVAVIADRDAAPAGDAAFSIHLGETDDAGRVVATVATVLETDVREADALEPECMALRARLWKRLGEVMPFFEKHLVLAHSPFEAKAPHVPGGRGSYDVPRALPLAMSPVWRATDDIGYVIGLKNVTLTGDYLLPALGIEGALAAGWSAAKVACALAGKKKDYLRDEVVGAA